MDVSHAVRVGGVSLVEEFVNVFGGRICQVHVGCGSPSLSVLEVTALRKVFDVLDVPLIVERNGLSSSQFFDYVNPVL